MKSLKRVFLIGSALISSAFVSANASAGSNTIFHFDLMGSKYKLGTIETTNGTSAERLTLEVTISGLWVNRWVENDNIQVYKVSFIENLSNGLPVRRDLVFRFSSTDLTSSLKVKEMADFLEKLASEKIAASNIKDVSFYCSDYDNIFRRGLARGSTYSTYIEYTLYNSSVSNQKTCSVFTLLRSVK